MRSPIPLNGTVFLEGPAGTGKTTEATDYVRRLLEAGTAPEQILVLLPQRIQSQPFHAAAYATGGAGAAIDTLTYVAIANRAIQTYWPLVAEQAGFANPDVEPTFLGIETSQYYMARLAQPAFAAGDFAGVSLPPQRIISQTLDNLNRSAMLSLPLDQVVARLIEAWGEGPSSRPPAYGASRDLAEKFRHYCLENSLIDFSLSVDLFNRYLLHDEKFTTPFFARYSHLIVENVEEMNAAAHDFVAEMLLHVQGALLIYDTDAGYRIFLGAEPDDGYNLRRRCDTILSRAASKVASTPIQQLIGELTRVLKPDFSEVETEPAYDPDQVKQAFQYAIRGYYPDMIEWVAREVIELVQNKHVPPRQIAIVGPYLNDSLRFSLTYRLNQAGIATLSHRPSRALRDEPAARAMLTFAQLAYPSTAHLTPYHDVADALFQVLGGIDPLRARLLAGGVYNRRQGMLVPFEEIAEEARTRVTYQFGKRYETLRKWLAEQAMPDLPLDFFFQKFFGEVVSQPGFGFHKQEEAGRVIAQLINSARTFRETLYPDGRDLAASRVEYFGLIEQGLLSGFYAPNWLDEDADAVFISPAFTFLIRNRFVDYQFWLDIGSVSWSERIEQPLTHPYILRRENTDVLWNDELEREEGQRRLYSLATGLARRCRNQIYLGISDLSEEGFEQTGLLLGAFQNIVRRTMSEDSHE